MTGTLGNFYMIHASSGANVADYINQVPQQFKALARGHNTKLICLELFINMAQYRDREDIENGERGASSAAISSASSRKRTASTTPGDGVALHKRAKALANTNIGSKLGSRFGSASNYTPPLLQAKTRSKVSLQRSDITIDPTTFEPESFQRPGIVEALISDTEFAKGGSKLAFDMLIVHADGKEDRVVAKRIYRASDDVPEGDASVPITLIANRAHLEAECIRLATAQHLFKAFMAYVKEMKVEIFPYIEIAAAYLATEKAVQVTRSPSVASGLESFASFDALGMTWMVETKRAAAVINFTSTLDHKLRGTDLQTLTVHAFAHYVFGASGGTMALADIQGTPASVRGNDGLVLFDVMTHTTAGGSGLGDFGREGLESFIDTHECGPICKRLEFDDVFPLELDIDIPGPDPTDASGSELGLGNDEQDDVNEQ